MKKLRDKKYFALIMVVVLFLGVLLINKIGSVDKYAGEIKVTKAYVNNIKTSLNASVVDAVNENAIESKGYDTVDYVIKYNLDENENVVNRNVIVKAKLNDDEKYASFKEIKIENVESILSENKKEIELKVKNAKVGKENQITLKMLIQGAPNGYKVNPQIEIKEETEENYKRIATQEIEVKTNSITGLVKDENNLPVSNIELKLIKNEEEIKRTYTDKEGRYVFTDIEEGTYQIEVEEDKYEKVSNSVVEIKEGQTLDIEIKQVKPYEIKINKYITSLKIVNNGKEENYTYGEISKVQQAIKKLKEITGEIKYKIVVENIGKKEGIVTVVKDELPEGLKFEQKKNSDWELKNGILYNRTLEGATLKAGQKIEVSLVLDIEKTNEAKVYINKVTAKGEIYEKIVYILNGKTYKEEEVLEGEKIKNPNVTIEKFEGWYTDKNYTNKYNFDNEVTKDLILYGKIDNKEIYKVEFYDNNELVKELSKEENTRIENSEVPEVSKEGYSFIGWYEKDAENSFDFTTKITRNIKLYSKYQITKNAVIFNDENRITTKEVEYGSMVEPINDQGKSGYTFKYWSKIPNGEAFDFNTPIKETTTLYAVYTINSFTVRFIDKGLLYKTETVEYNNKVTKPEDPNKANNIFIGWTLNDNIYDFETLITEDITLYSKYEEVEKPIIEHRPTEWTKDDVTVTIKNDNHPEYSFKYKINDGEYQEYTGEFTVSENCAVVAKSIKENVESVIEIHEIDNIDKIEPKILLLEASVVGKTSFSININSKDNESGMKYLKIYLDDEYKTTIVYNNNYNEEKKSTYTFEGLNDGQTYKVRVEAIDVVGNVSDASEIEVTTTKEKIVAQIIGRNNSLYETEDEYEDFTLLELAIEACGTSQCTIRMVDNTVESVEVLEGQDVKLNLNGYIVKGKNSVPYTIQNQGNLTIIDTEDEKEGAVLNTEDTAIKNISTGVLQIGENEEPLIVSITKPNIVGTTYGIYLEDESTFNFYDGKIEGNVAIRGNVDDTPNLYNTSVSTTDHQIAILNILADVEAKIEGGKYYTKLANAISESKNGEYVDITSNVSFLGSFLPEANSNENFVYDEENQILYSTNRTGISSIYTIIDLRDYEEDQVLEITGYIANLPENNRYRSARFYINPQDGGNVSIENSSFSRDSKTLKSILQKGYKYKLSITYNASDEDDSITDENNIPKLIISNINLSNYKSNKIDTKRDDDSSALVINYGFDYDENKKIYVSNNRYKPYTKAFSYVELDLTNEVNNKLLIVNATLDTKGGSSYGNILIKEDNEILQNSLLDGSNVVASVYSKSSSSLNKGGPLNYSKIIAPGKKYYLQFYYFNNTSLTEEEGKELNITDTFTINSIDLIDEVNTTTGEEIIQNMVKAEDSQYEFEKSGSSYSPNNSSVDTLAHSYIMVDLTNESNDKYIDVKLNASSNLNFYVEVSDNKELPDSKNAFINSKNKSYNSSGNIIGALQKNKVNYIHFVYNKTSSSGSISIYNVKLCDGKSIDLETSLKKSGANGLDAFSDYYGSYYNDKSDKELVADSYVKIDLSEYTENQVLKINASLNSSSNIKYFYITSNTKNHTYEYIKNNVNDTLLYFDYNSNYYSNYYNYKDYYYILEKGNVYYLHIASYNLKDFSDTVYLKNILLFPEKNNILNVGNTHNMSKGTEEPVLEQETPTYIIDEEHNSDMRFIGLTAKNYVKFNNELWRIVGVFDTEDSNGITKKRIKIMRNSSIGNFSWDTSAPYSETSQNTNAGNGITEWSQADIMKLLNPGYDSESIGGSLYWNKSSGSCYSGSGNTSTTCDFTSSGLNKDSKNMIDDVKWYTGAIPYGSDGNNLTPYELITYEKSSNTSKTNYDPNGFPADDVERTTSWIGKVGLLYPSDFILAASDGNRTDRDTCMNSGSSVYGDCITNNNWIYNLSPSYPMYTITPPFKFNSSSNYYPFLGVLMNSTLVFQPVCYSFSMFPTIYLKTNSYIKSGDGSETNPYVIELKDNENKDSYYGLKIKKIELDTDESNIISIDNSSDDYKNIKNNTIYGFTYDENTKKYTNNNSDVIPSVAAEYIKIDTLKENKDKYLEINYEISAANNDVAYVHIFKDIPSSIDYVSDPSGAEFVCLGTDSGIKRYILESGHEYYIQFAYVKKDSSLPTETIKNTLEISFSMVEETDKSEEFTRYEDTIPVLNETPDTVVLIKDIVVNETLVIPETQNVILDLNGNSLVSGGSEIFENNGTLRITDNKYEKIIEPIISSDNNDYASNNLIVFYNMIDSEYSEDSISDLSGNNNNGTIVGPILENKALHFDGLDDYVDIAEINSDYVTVETIFSGDEIQAGEACVACNYEAGGYGIYLKDGYIRGQIYANSTYHYIQTSYVIVPGEKYYTQMTYDGKTLSLYVNNELIGTKEISGVIGIPKDSTKFMLGNNPKGSSALSGFFKGKIYSFRIYSKALSEEEINLNYNIDYYKFENRAAILPSSSLSSSNGLVIQNNENAYLELDNCNIIMTKSGSSSSDENAISNSGLLSIKKNASIKTTGTYTSAINNSKTAKFIDNEYGKIIVEGTSSAYAIKNSGDTDISKLNIMSNGYGILIAGFGDIHDNNIKSQYASISSSSNTASSIYNNLITSTTVAIIKKYSDGAMIIKNNDIYGSLYNNSSTGTVTVENGNFINMLNTDSLVINAGTMNINGGTFKSGLDTVKNNGILTINDGNIINTDENGNNAIENTATLTINGGNIEALGNTIENKSKAILNVFGGNIYSKNNGIYIYKDGIVNIGNNDENVLTNNAYIKGDKYAIYSDSTPVAFFDGTLIGKDDIIHGTIGDYPENYDLYLYDNENYMYANLEANSKRKVAKIGNTEYETLFAAINSIESNEQTNIEIIDNIYTINPIDINSDRNIIVDLNGHSIKTYSNNYFISNSGVFEFKDSQSVYGESNVLITLGKIFGNSQKLFVNNSDLKLSYIQIQTCIYDNIGLYNTGDGSVTIDKSLLETNIKDYTKEYSFIINDENGMVNINNSVINTIGKHIVSDTYSMTANLINNNSNQGINIDNSDINYIFDIEKELISRKTYNLFAINNSNGNLNIANSSINSNISNSGHSIHVTGGNIFVNNSDININSKTGSSSGIYITTASDKNGSVTVNETNIVSNSETDNSYGLYFSSHYTIAINNSNIEFNGARGNGIRNINSIVELDNVNINTNEGLTAIDNYGKLTYKNGTILQTITPYKYENSIYNESDSEIIIKDVTINGNIFSKSNSKFSIDGGSIVGNGKSHSLYLFNVAESNIKNVTIKNDLKKNYSAILIDGGNNINIDGVNVNARTGTRIINQVSSDVSVLNSTINTIEECIQNLSDIIVIIDNTNITSSSSVGIDNVNNGNIIYKSGEINALKCAIQNAKTGTITIGNKLDFDENNQQIVLKDTPYIFSQNEQGICSNSTSLINFYDGTVKGYPTAIVGTINEIPDDYEIINEYDDNNHEIKYLGTQPVAKIGDKTFNSLQAAVNFVSDNELTTIELIRDLTTSVSQDPIEVSKNKKIILDLYGHVINQSNSEFINNDGDFMIIDTDSFHGGKINSISGVIVNNSGKFVLSNPIVSLNDNGNIFTNTGDFELAGGNITSGNIENNGSGTITISTGTAYSITNEESGNVYVNGGVVSDHLYNKANGTVTIKSNTQNVKNYGEGTINIESGTISTLTSSVAIENISNGTINVSGGNINSESERYVNGKYGIKNTGNGIINITGGNISIGIDFNSSQYGIYNSSGIVNFDSGEIHFKDKDSDSIYTYGIYNVEGEVNVTNASAIYGDYSIYNQNGTVNAEKGSLYGTILNSRGILNFGIKDNIVDNDLIFVKSSTYGIANSGILNIYDGKIYGYEGAIRGVINEIEENYRIISDKEETYNIKYLDNLTSLIVNGTEYYDFKTAIDSIPINTETKIKLIRDYTNLHNDETITIPSNKNIIIDLNGFNIDQSNNTFFNNEGTLTITDGTSIADGDNFEFGTSSVNIFDEIFVENLGNLEIRNLKLDSLKDNEYKTLVNKGNLIASNLQIDGAIHSVDNSSLEINNVKFTRFALDDSNVYYIYAKNVINFIADKINVLDNKKILYLEGEFNSSISNSTLGKIFNNSSGESTLTNVIAVNFDNNSNGLSKVNNSTITNFNNNQGTNTIDNSVITSLNNNIGDTSIDNSTIENISNNNTGYIKANDSTVNGSIINNLSGTIEINNVTIENPYYLDIIRNKSEGKIIFNSGNIIGKNSSKYTYQVISNESTGIIEINGGTIKSVRTGTGDYYAINNESTGVVNISGGKIISEGGSDTIHNSNGTINICGKSEDLNDAPEIISTEGNAISYINENTTKFENAKITGQVRVLDDSNLNRINNVMFTNGKLRLIHSNKNNITLSNIIINNENIDTFIYISKDGKDLSDINLNNIKITSTGTSPTFSIWVEGVSIGLRNVDINISNPNSSGISINYGKLHMNENVNISMEGNESSGIKNSGTIYMYNNNTIKTTGDDSFGIKSDNGTTYIYANSSIISSGNNSYGVFEPSGNIYLGEKDKNISLENPYIYGSINGIGGSGNIYFYDGCVSGIDGAINGKIVETEDGYKVSISTDDQGIKSATLTPIGDNERVAVMNGINFIDLQSAINAASDTEESIITIYSNIVFDSDITIPESKNIKLYLNGYTITYGDYSFIENGTINIIEGSEQTGLVANIVNMVKDVLNISTNARNIIIYEMEDGSKLSAEKTYKLYKENAENYNLLKMEKEEEIGRYIVGNDIDELRTVKGRIYLNNLGTGKYKLVDNEGKEISFAITDEGKLEGNIAENFQTEKTKVIASAVAELILTIATGTAVGHYFILLILISIIIVLLYLVQKQKKSLN